ncbi:MAG TPA: FtsX-like permease family protein, partial [Bryobacteraceae bacterium]|nr:FtsX-like permease family protein [Bryobacteraceae bacterium]
RFFTSLMDRARAIPSVSAAAVVDCAPLHSLSFSNFYIAGRPEPPISSLPIADQAHASAGYFQTIGLRLLAGRYFTDADMLENERDGVVIVNQAFLRQFFPGENPLGHRLMRGDKKNQFEIVGVVSDFRPMGVEEGDRSTIFWPDLRLNHATLIVRAGTPSDALAPALRNTIWSLDRELPAGEVRSIQYYIDETLSQRTFNTLLLGIFAALALLLGVMGIYGVLSNLVASRIREIGIRMAIGATPAEIRKLVLRQGMAPVAIGLCVGLAASLVVSRFLESLLFHVRARDPLTLTVAVGAILAIAPVAISIPLRRATRVDCTVALREE